MKILYVTTIAGTLRFFLDIIKELTADGHTIDVACRPFHTPDEFETMSCRMFPVCWSRSMFSKGNLKSIREIKSIVEDGKYDVVHCHTPVASACTRLACKKIKKTAVIYTAHGFHFYKGAPLKNWLLFYPLEKFLSRFTDVMITINKDDYELAAKEFHAKVLEYVPGVGIDISKFSPDKEAGDVIRKELELTSDRKVILSVGEMNDNKNHEAVVRALEGMDVTYVILGIGEMHDALEKIAEEKGVDLRMPGYRHDTAAFYNAADVYVLPSKREGLNVSIMEAMASGLPVACGRIRGNVDLIDDGKGGLLFNPCSPEEIAEKIADLLSGEHSREYGEYNMKKILEFSLEKVNSQIRDIYEAAAKNKNSR